MHNFHRKVNKCIIFKLRTGGKEGAGEQWVTRWAGRSRRGTEACAGSERGKWEERGDPGQSWSQVSNSGAIPLMTRKEASQFDLTCLLWPGGAYLAKGEVPGRRCGSCLLAFLLIGTCPRCEWQVAEPQGACAAVRLWWNSLLQKDATLHFWASDILLGFICREATSKPFTWKKDERHSDRETIQSPKQGDSWRQTILKSGLPVLIPQKKAKNVYTEPREGKARHTAVTSSCWQRALPVGQEALFFLEKHTAVNLNNKKISNRCYDEDDASRAVLK